MSEVGGSVRSWRWVAIIGVLGLVAAVTVPAPARAAPNGGDTLELSGSRRIVVAPAAGAPATAGLIVGSPPQVTGGGAVDTDATPPRATASVAAQGRYGVAEARMGAAFATTAPAGGPVLGTLEITIADVRWAGQLRWNGGVTDFSAPTAGGATGCPGCLEGQAAVSVVASVVDLDSGALLAAKRVAGRVRTFRSADPVTEWVAGSETVTFDDVQVASGTRVGVYLTLTTRASSGLRPGVTTGAAIADFAVGDATTTTTTGKRPGKVDPNAVTKGVTYRSVAVRVVGTDPLEEESACPGPALSPEGPAQTAIVEYYRAIDAGEHAIAYALLDPELQAGWASIGPSTDGAANFAAFMGDHVDCVVVTGIETRSVPGDPEVSASTGIQWYEVQLDARYSSPLPAGSGEFPPYMKVKADPHTGPGRPPDRILDIATSLPQTSVTTAPPPSTSTSTTTTSRPATSTSTTTSTTTTTTTTVPPRELSGPRTVVALGDSFISGEAGRWNGNAFDPFLDRAGTDRAFRWGESTTLQAIESEVSSWSWLLGWFTETVVDWVEAVVDVPTYPTEVVYGATDSELNRCHRSDVAEVNAPIPGIEKHVNLACSGATADKLWLPAYDGVRQVEGEATQIEQLRDLARSTEPGEEVQIELIVLSIGGNDLQFSTIVADCVFAYAESSALQPEYCEPAWDQFVADRLDRAVPDNVPSKVESTIDQIREVMETPMEQGGAGYAPDQYRIVLQSYPSPMPRGSGPNGSEFAMAEALPLETEIALALTPLGLLTAGAATNARVVYGCPFWDSDATWARDELVPDLSEALRGVAQRTGVAFLDLQDFLQNREVCSKYTSATIVTGPPSGATSEWARSIYLSAHFDLFQGDPKEAIHPNAYAQQGLQRCLAGAYDAAWADPSASVRCVNRPGGPENVVTVVEP